jgi:hypothetical protein
MLLLVAFSIGCGESYTFAEDFDLSRDDVDWYETRRTVDQGVMGQVVHIDEHNAFDVAYSVPVETEVRVYDVTSMRRVTFDGSVDTHAAISKIDEALIATTVSGDDGFFELDLGAGSYSLFVKAPESDTWYCVDWNDKDQMCVFDVEWNTATIYNIELDYTLAY